MTGVEYGLVLSGDYRNIPVTGAILGRSWICTGQVHVTPWCTYFIRHKLLRQSNVGCIGAAIGRPFQDFG